MKKFLLVALLIGIVAISGCVQETPAEEQEQPPAQQEEQEQQTTQTTTTTQTQTKNYDPLTSAEMDDITETKEFIKITTPILKKVIYI